MVCPMRFALVGISAFVAVVALAVAQCSRTFEKGGLERRSSNTAALVRALGSTTRAQAGPCSPDCLTTDVEGLLCGQTGLSKTLHYRWSLVCLASWLLCGGNHLRGRP